MDQDQFESSNQQSFENSINLRHYWHVVQERRGLIITVFVSIMILTLIYLFRAQPIYEAQARLQIDKEGKGVLVDGISFDSREQDYQQTQYKNLQSRALIAKVVEDMGLAEDDRYAESRDVVRAVMDDVAIAPIRLSRLVDIKFQHPDPTKAARVANNLATNFIQMNLDKKMDSALSIVVSLQREAKKQLTNVLAAEQALQEYHQAHQIMSFENSENIVLQAVKQYQSDLDVAAAKAASLETVVHEVDELLKAGHPMDSIPQVSANTEIQAMKRDLALLDAEFRELQKRYKHKHPKFIRAQEKIASLQDSMSQTAESLVEALRNEALIAKATEKQMARLVEQKKKEQMRLKELKIQYEALKREADQQAMLYASVLSRMKELELTGNNMLNNMHLVDAAVPGLNPVKPRKALTLFLGAFGGMAMALGLAFFVNYLDDSVKSQDDVESYLRMPFLGYIPNIKSNSVVERDLQAHLHPQSTPAEGFRTIRATLSLTHKVDRYKLVAVTSTIPSEGKSLIASNLAIVNAQTGLRTLLVDTDLRRPSVHKAYQLSDPKGLAAYLSDEVRDPSEIIHESEVPNLDIVCCGSLPATPSELVGSKRMRDFLEMAAQKYDRVVLDCPPVSAVSDPLVIASLCDGVIYVTKFNKIRREHVRRSIQRIQDAGIHVMGVVLNDIDFEGRDSYYYSYYYYQNQYYASHYQTKPDATAEPARTRN